MDIIKQYIIQTIAAAANNLRLSTEKVEVVALLRESISKTEDINEYLKKMKKVTELSTLAIRLHRTYSFLTEDKIDFFKLSDNFKDHSRYLINDLSHMLEMVNPKTFKKIIDKLEGKEEEKEPTEIPALTIESESEEPEIEQEEKKPKEISVDLSKRKSDEHVFEIDSEEEIEREREKNKIKEDAILSSKENDEHTFEDYEKDVLNPIKDIEELLQNLSHKNIDNDKIEKYIEIINQNAEASKKIGFSIISGMHKILAKSLFLIKQGTLKPNVNIIESMRACLIVIAAVIKGKDVEITTYLNKAEELGRILKNQK